MPTLKEIRRGLLISTKKLVLLSGVSESTIIRIEKGGKYQEENIEKILAALSKVAGQEIKRDSIEGLNEPYNPIRDRGQTPKEEEVA